MLRKRRAEVAAMQNFQQDELSIEVSQQDEHFRVIWRGKSVARDPSVTLAPFFSQLLLEAQEQQSGIELHFETIEHCNSATLSAVIQFVRDALNAQVAVRLHYDASRSWQRIGFAAFRMLEQADLFEVITGS